MRLSIIVPVYNMMKDGKLVYCLESLINQTITDYEIIAVDDCSTDGSFSVLQQYQDQYPEIMLAIHSTMNRKQGGAKNIGLSLAKGEWIGFIDSDDWVTHDYYERLLLKAEETGADMVGCDYSLTGEHSMKVGQVVHNNRPSQCGVLDKEKYRQLILDSGSLVVKIYKRHIILDYPTRFPEHIFYEDNAISNSWMLRAKHFAYIPEPLYYYYQHETSTVHTITKKRCEDRMEAARIMIKEARKFSYLEDYYPEIEYSFTQLFYINTLFTYMFGVKKLELSFLRKMGREMKKAFPDFLENPYYCERTNEEEKRLILMHLKSSLFFVIYFKLLWFYRNCRKKIGK